MYITRTHFKAGILCEELIYTSFRYVQHADYPSQFKSVTNWKFEVNQIRDLIMECSLLKFPRLPFRTLQVLDQVLV